MDPDVPLLDIKCSPTTLVIYKIMMFCQGWMRNSNMNQGAFPDPLMAAKAENDIYFIPVS